MKKLLLILSLITTAFGQSSEETLQKMEQELNKLTKAQGTFIQSTDGITNKGSIYIDRPKGKLRFEYDPPSPLMIIADGYWMTKIDKELQTTTKARLYKTPLGFLLKEQVNLKSDVEIININNSKDRLNISFKRKNQKTDNKEQITLNFNPKTYALLGWIVSDQAGQNTSFKLQDLQHPKDLDAKLFILPKEYERN